MARAYEDCCNYFSTAFDRWLKFSPTIDCAWYGAGGPSVGSQGRRRKGFRSQRVEFFKTFTQNRYGTFRKLTDVLSHLGSSSIVREAVNNTSWTCSYTHIHTHRHAHAHAPQHQSINSWMAAIKPNMFSDNFNRVERLLTLTICATLVYVDAVDKMNSKIANLQQMLLLLAWQNISGHDHPAAFAWLSLEQYLTVGETTKALYRPD